MIPFRTRRTADMKPRVSICIAVRDSEKYIGNCIRSLVAQTTKDFEIVVIEDPPYDNTRKILYSFKDERIVYVRNSIPLGIYKTRNVCIKQAKGDYIFFTDGDCVVSLDWIEQGLKLLSRSDCVGVEGKTYYVSERYEPSFSDMVIQNRKGGLFMTCNIAYKRAVIEKIGGFDERYSRVGDRDLALRSSRLGKIPFNPNMIVYHQKSVRTSREFIKKARVIIRNRVLVHKKFPANGIPKARIWDGRVWRIVLPLNLMIMIYPPLIIGSFLVHKYKTKEDLTLFPYIYLMAISERLSLWNECAKQRVFLI